MNRRQVFLNSWEKTIDADFGNLYPRAILVIMDVDTNLQSGGAGRYYLISNILHSQIYLTLKWEIFKCTVRKWNIR